MSQDSQHLRHMRPEDWRIEQRADGWWLQQTQESGAWGDIRGPYRQRGGAAAYYRRLVVYAIRIERMERIERSETTSQQTTHY